MLNRSFNLFHYSMFNFKLINDGEGWFYMFYFTLEEGGNDC